MSDFAISSNNALSPWMVEKLFGSPSSDAPDIKPQDLTTSSNTINSATLRGVSDQTAEALTSLQRGGECQGDTSSTDLLSVKEVNAIIQSAHAMTSDEVNAAMYSHGLQTTANGKYVNFNKYVENFKSQLDLERTGTETNEDLSDTDRAANMQSIKTQEDAVDALVDAYKTGTLTFQNAYDVQGLDFNDQVIAIGQADKPPEGFVNNNQFINFDFIRHNPDGKHHDVIDVGNGLTQYLTW